MLPRIPRFALTCVAVAAAVSACGQEDGQKIVEHQDCPECPVMVEIPAGKFQLGDKLSHEASPVRTIKIEQPFLVAKHETTVGQFRAFVEASNYKIPSKGCGLLKRKDDSVTGQNWRRPGFDQDDNHPVVCVTWVDAIAYVKWLTERTSQPYRLLSESEWEYVARAGENGRTPWRDSKEACRHANVFDLSAYEGRQGSNPDNRKKYIFNCRDGAEWTAQVGSYLPNAFGVHNMLGNVLEWVMDCSKNRYHWIPRDGSPMLNAGVCAWRQIRGHSWRSNVKNVSLFGRGYNAKSVRGGSLGFRVARDVAPIARQDSRRWIWSHLPQRSRLRRAMPSGCPDPPRSQSGPPRKLGQPGALHVLEWVMDCSKNRYHADAKRRITDAERAASCAWRQIIGS